MIVAGLTGNIASGKSTVATFLRRSGALIIDADQIAHDVVAPGQPALEEIRRHFGDDMLTPEGLLNREKLGRMVFEDPDARRRLEAIVHPRVSAEIDRQMARIAENHPDAVVIMDIPLLFETGRTEGLTDIIVVYTPEPIQLERLTRRNGLSPAEAKARMASQMPLKEKVARATMVIDNSGTLAETERQTLAVYRRLARKARQ
ncbi:dephospho-CoA kinase [Desulfatitalea tepidiphila]|uniref:dephospho-CoA kinase n=1 Tax=Desulfatitalea tepidiphila TaxID=1185843 RepID=UPI00190FD953|nr:dephospho-CoA kinase [Desulfatitalea tepidiphila]